MSCFIVAIHSPLKIGSVMILRLWYKVFRATSPPHPASGPLQTLKVANAASFNTFFLNIGRFAVCPNEKLLWCMRAELLCCPHCANLITFAQLLATHWSWVTGLALIYTKFCYFSDKVQVKTRYHPQDNSVFHDCVMLSMCYPQLQRKWFTSINLRLGLITIIIPWCRTDQLVL